MLFLQFAFSFTGTLQQAKDRHVGMGAGSCIKMASDQKIRVLIAHRPKVLSKAIRTLTFRLLAILTNDPAPMTTCLSLACCNVPVKLNANWKNSTSSTG